LRELRFRVFLFGAKNAWSMIAKNVPMNNPSKNGLTDPGTEYYETYRESHDQTESTLNKQALRESQIAPNMK